jgi:hypothetical protein
MRKLLVMLVSVTLLIISSVPISAATAFCTIPVHTSTMDDMAADMDQGMLHEDTHVQHDHDMALNNDWQRDRIECGCGCHNSIDSLPHVLAPHMTSDSIQMPEQLSVTVQVQPETAWLVHAVRVPLPPPQI